jgi:hypothetical protein
MSDQPSHQGHGPSRKFIPDVNSLESRCLLSTTIPQSDVIVGHPHPPHTGGLAIQSGLAITDDLTKFPRAPHTGGLAFQSGSVLNCVAGQPNRNTVQVIDKGQGTVEMSWNFGQFHTFTGVTTTIIQAQRARTNQFTFNLTHGDTVTAVAVAARTTFQRTGPSTGSNGIELSPHRPADSGSAKAAGHPLAHLHNEKGGLTIETDSELKVAANRAKAVNEAKVKIEHGGLAVQTGSELTVTVNRPTTNVVDFKVDKVVEVEWNGGMVHSFTGVATIIVNTRNARLDQVTFQDSSTGTAALAGDLIWGNNGTGQARVE